MLRLHHGPDCGRPMKSFFIEMPNFWAWAENLTDNFIVIWGIFGQFISTHFETVSPLSMFPLNQPLFLQKTKHLKFELSFWEPHKIWKNLLHGLSIYIVRRNIFSNFVCFSESPNFISKSQISIWDWDLNLGCKELGI